MHRAHPVAAVALALVLVGCGTSDSGDDAGPGLTKEDVTREGDERCAFDEEFRAAVEDAGFDAEVGEYPAGFDQVILHIGDQDYADSADSTDLFDVRGAYQICRYSIGDDYIAEAYLYWFGPTADRERLEDAEAWEYALDDVSFDLPAAPTDVGIDEPVAVPNDEYRAAVSAVRARGKGASAAISISVDGYRPDPDSPPRSLSGLSLSGPLPPEKQVVDLLGAIAEALSAR